MILQKRGQLTQNTIVGMVLVVVGAALIILFIGKYTPLYGDVFDTETCRGSVAARATIEKSTTLAELFKVKPKLACRTKDVCISSGGKCPTGSEKESVANEEDIKKEISKLMYDCWYQLGEGKLNFVEDELLNVRIVDGKPVGSHVCVVCSRIKFSEDAKKDFKTLTGIGKYLAENKPLNSKFTYLQHFTKNPEVELLGEEKTLDLSKEYAIIYRISKKEFFSNLLGGGTGAALALGGAAKLGIIGTVAGPLGTISGIAIGGGIGFIGAYAGESAISNLKDAIGKTDPKVFYLELLEHDAPTIYKACADIEGLG